MKLVLRKDDSAFKNTCNATVRVGAQTPAATKQNGHPANN